MLIKNDDGTYTAGPLDAMVILHDVTTGRYHPAFFVEAPFPGPPSDVEVQPIVRLKSQLHHTKGAATLVEAQVLFDEMSGKIQISEHNQVRGAEIPWTGELGLVWVVSNWRKARKSLAEVLQVGDHEAS